MDEENPAFTGFLNKSLKRIDLVLVIADEGSKELKNLRVHYLKNVIKFGLEVEMEKGMMPEHGHLIFVKIHAPDTIIEENGVYFKVRKFFKDSHVNHITPFLYSFGIKRELEWIQLVRKQYPGPGNYSTIERSSIVFNIICRLPFGQKKQMFGMSRLQQQHIILDAFALHDGPYFLASNQKNCINARQTLFYNWVGIRNIWKTHPIHMIQEYLGERPAMYFAYYEYFNFMLLFPGILGILITMANYFVKETERDLSLEWFVCTSEYVQYMTVCPQCRYFKICPIRPASSYCKEVESLARIDTSYMRIFALFVSIWAIVFNVTWMRTQNYLSWMWEMKEHFNENVINPDYYNPHEFCRSRLTAVLQDKLNFKETFKWSLQILLSIILFGVWMFSMFFISTQIWYIKYRLHTFYNGQKYTDTDNEVLFIGTGAAVYSILTTALKMIAKPLADKLTVLENNKTIGSYSCSLALKLYGFFFTGTFTLLTLHLFVGNIFYTHILDLDNWHSVGGFKLMSNRLGSSLDDMCITLAVAVVIEQIIVKIPFYLKRKKTDYQIAINSPIWEREYQLESLKDEYFHNEYNNIAMQFGMATLFSLTFPLAPLLILLVNIWDIRHKAKNFILVYRRPLLLNRSGPAVWNKIFFFTSYLVPIFNVFIIALQSISFLINEAFIDVWNLVGYGPGIYYGFETNIPEFTAKAKHALLISKTLEQELMIIKRTCKLPVYDHWFEFYEEYNGQQVMKFDQEYTTLHVKNFKYQYIIIYCVLGVLINLVIYYVFPTRSNDIEDAIKIEERIKQKYVIRKRL